MSPINSRFLAVPRHLYTRIRTHSHVRVRYHWWVGKAAIRHDERETNEERKRERKRERSIGSAKKRLEGEKKREEAKQNRRRRENEQASGTEKLWAKLLACWRRSVGPRWLPPPTMRALLPFLPATIATADANALRRLTSRWLYQYQ